MSEPMQPEAFAEHVAREVLACAPSGETTPRVWFPDHQREDQGAEVVSIHPIDPAQIACDEAEQRAFETETEIDSIRVCVRDERGLVHHFGVSVELVPTATIDTHRIDVPDEPAIPEGWARRGEFTSFEQWVAKASTWIGGSGAVCVDAQGRRCGIGRDFMRARDEGAFPVGWYLP